MASSGGGLREEMKALQQQLKDSKRAHAEAIALVQVSLVPRISLP